VALIEVVPLPGVRWCAWCRDAGRRTIAVASLTDDHVPRPLGHPGEPMCARHALARQSGAASLPPVGPVVLVGPPAIGKTTVGRELGALLGQPCCDTDAAVEAEVNQTIPQIFAESGEPAFRELEHRAAASAIRNGGVVCLGGGAVTTPEVRDALRGLPVVWLALGVGQVPSHVGTGGRPLLDGDDPQAAWRRLAAEREPLYAAVSCLRVNRTGRQAREVAEAIAGALDWPVATKGEMS